MFCQTNYGLFESTERFDRTLTALGNHIRAVCYEFGLTINLGKAPINKAIVEFASKPKGSNQRGQILTSDISDLDL